MCRSEMLLPNIQSVSLLANQFPFTHPHLDFCVHPDNFYLLR